MRVLLVAAVIIAANAANGSHVQPGAHTHEFEPFRELTVTGSVQLIRAAGLETCEACNACSDCASEHIVLRASSGHYEVHLAPAWFLQLHGWTVAVGDRVTVTGTRVRTGRWRGMAARLVTNGRVTVTLRDEHGLPLWRRIPTT